MQTGNRRTTWLPPSWWQIVSRLSRSVSATLSRLTLPLRLGTALLCLSLFAGCAATRSPEPRKLAECVIPTAKLQPTQEPPLSDGTNGSMMQECNQCRLALQSCNQDKKTTLEILTYQNQLRTQSSSESTNSKKD